MTAEEFSRELIPEFKRRGYKKRRLTWYKRCSDTTILFWLQKSQFSKDVWYYNFCVGFNSFWEREITSYEHCDISNRFDQVYDDRVLTAEFLIAYLDKWEERYSDLRTIRELARSDKLPFFTTIRAESYLLGLDFGS